MSSLVPYSAYHMEPRDEWIHQAWGLFFQDATLEEVKSTHEKFEPVSMIYCLAANLDHSDCGGRRYVCIFKVI